MQDKIRQSFAGLQGGIGEVCSTAVAVFSGEKNGTLSESVDLMMMFSVIELTSDNWEIDG